MSINEIIIYIMVLFMVIGGIDKCIGNKFGYGEKFEEGIMAMGSLAVAMVGIISLAPVLGKLLTPIVGPIYSAWDQLLCLQFLLLWELLRKKISHFLQKGYYQE